MGRLKRWTEEMQARFEVGTFSKIAECLEADEDRTGFVRAAGERELERRSSTKRSE